MPLITIIACPCGHESRKPFEGDLAADLLPRARCGACGHLGADWLRHVYVAEANAMEGARVASQNGASASSGPKD